MHGSFVGLVEIYYFLNFKLSVANYSYDPFKDIINFPVTCNCFHDSF